MATQLFEPQALGTPTNDGGGADMYRGLAFDESTGELFLVDLDELFRFGPDSTVPEKIADAWAGDAEFWLRPDSFMFADGPEVDDSTAVLFEMPRAGGDLQPRILLETDSPVYENVFKQWVKVIDNDVYWVQRHQVDGVSVYSLLKTTIDVQEVTEENTQLLYTAAEGNRLDDGYIAGGSVYIIEQTDYDDDTQVQLKIDAVSGEVLVADIIASEGGKVVDAAGDWLLFAYTKDPQTYVAPVVRRAANGSSETELDETSIEGLNELAVSGDLWVYIAWGDTGVYKHLPGQEPESIGCIPDDTTVHAMTLGPDFAYLSAYRDNRSTILTYPLN